MPVFFLWIRRLIALLRLPDAFLIAMHLFLLFESPVHGNPPAQPARQSVIGIIAKSHAVRRPIPGGFGNSFEFQFVRFLDGERTNRELTVHYVFEWITAFPHHLENAGELIGRQAISFSAPTQSERIRGYQSASRRIAVATNSTQGANCNKAGGLQFRVSLLPSFDGSYLVVDDSGRLIREMNRRWAEHSVLCRIYEGCVVACLPNDKPSSTEHHPVDPHDLDQFIPDCYLIAAMAAAARRDPNQVANLITRKPDGFVVTFPGQQPILLPSDLDRGPDMVESRVLDVDSYGNVELWPVLIERAFAILNSRMKSTCSGHGLEFLDVANGDSQQAYHLLTGRSVLARYSWEYGSRQAQLKDIHRHLLSTGPVLMATGKWTNSGDRPYWWLEDHVYVVTNIGETGKTITLIDPNCGRLVERVKIGDWLDSTEVKRFLFCD